MQLLQLDVSQGRRQWRMRGCGEIVTISELLAIELHGGDAVA
jgi:hypothetical protein